MTNILSPASTGSRPLRLEASGTKAMNHRYFRHLRCCFLMAVMVVGYLGVLPAPAVAQKAADKGSEKAEIKIPEAKNVTLDTKDGVQLKCTYLPPPTNPDEADGKGVVPFILVHDWDGTRKDMIPYGKYLQSLGAAVIIPDLRGHGESLDVLGSTKKLDYERFRKNELVSVVKDLETCKRYLVQRNNDAELNIDLLNIVAVGESSVFAIFWAIGDWNWAPVGGIKQGQDVKSVTLISPRAKLKNLNLLTELKHPLFSGHSGINLPTLIVWSDRGPAAKDCEEIYAMLEKGRPDLSKIDDPKEREKSQTLFKAVVPDSRLTGTELIRDNSVPGFWKYLAKFVGSQVIAKKDDYMWQSRERD